MSVDLEYTIQQQNCNHKHQTIKKKLLFYFYLKIILFIFLIVRVKQSFHEVINMLCAEHRVGL